MQALNHAPQPVEDEGESPYTAGVAVPSLVSSPTKSSSSSAPSSPMQDEPKHTSNSSVDDIGITRPDPMKDPALKFCSKLTSDACRCRHLEECMFPRFVSLDCKQMDDFCMGCVKDKPNMNNLGRLYIEALHLRDFLKSPETIISERNNPTKGSGKRGRNNADSPTRKRNRSSQSKKSKDKSDEQLTDNSRLSQAYFGGMEGKRTWFLANSHKVGKGGGIAGSFCKVLPSSTLNDISTEEDSIVLKTTGNKSTTGVPSDDTPDSLLSSEVKLRSLRNVMRLHDQTIPEDANPELASLENLAKPLPGYTPQGMDSSEFGNASNISGRSSKVSHNVSNEKPTDVSLAAGSQPMDIDRKEKQNGERLVPGSTPSNDNVDVSIPLEIPLSSNDTSLKERKTSIHSSEREDRQTNNCHAKLGDVSNESRGRPESNFNRAMHEGKEISLAANKLLESFRRNRRKFWAQKLRNGKAPSCAWCPSTSSRTSSFEFGVIRDGIATSNLDDDNSGGHGVASGDALFQCMECDLVGCAPGFLNGEKNGNQHAALHFLMSGHRFGVTCGPLGEIFCMKCGDIVYHECFDQERERIFLEQNIPSLCWKETPIIRCVDPSSFMATPENGVVWRGMIATYPTPVSAQLVQASRFAANRLSIFNSDLGDRSIELGPKALALSIHQQLHMEDRWLPVGIYNLGNTCFMNATLQCLVHCKPLQDLFLRKLGHPYQSCHYLRLENNKGTCLTCEMDRIFLEYYGSAVGIDTIAALEEPQEVSTDAAATRAKKQTNEECGHPIVPSSLLAEIWKTRAMKNLHGHAQHDAQEFFNAFIDCLATHALTYQKSAHDMRQIMHESQIKQSYPSENQSAKYDTDFINKIFSGTLRSVLVCQKCGCKRTQTESFSNVSLPLAKEFPSSDTQSRSSPRRGKISVKICLKHFTRPETLADTVYCPSCNSKTKTLKQHTFSTLPEVLCLHLKRFDAAANKKISDFVAFPAHDLDMGKHLPHWCERGLEMKEKNNEHTASSPKVLYDLFATVNHKGTLNQGHYVANVKCGNCWFTCNDAFVTHAGKGNGEKEVLSSDGAYMLFYQKKQTSV